MRHFVKQVEASFKGNDSYGHSGSVRQKALQTVSFGKRDPRLQNFRALELRHAEDDLADEGGRAGSRNGRRPQVPTMPRASTRTKCARCTEGHHSHSGNRSPRAFFRAIAPGSGARGSARGTDEAALARRARWRAAGWHRYAGCRRHTRSRRHAARGSAAAARLSSGCGPALTSAARRGGHSLGYTARGHLRTHCFMLRLSSLLDLGPAPDLGGWARGF